MQKKAYTLAEIAKQIEATLVGDPTVLLTGVASLSDANSQQLSFASSVAACATLSATAAGAVIVPEETVVLPAQNYLLSKNPRLAFAKAVELFDHKKSLLKGIHPSAVIADTSEIAATACIGANVSIGHYCKIGANTIIKANAVIADNVIIGDDCIIHQGTVIGSDGFGNANDRGHWYKIPQLGGVQIGNDVEIGANCTIDCGALGDTIIADGVRIDNLVHIAHNVVIGAHTAIAGQSGVAGSAVIGKHCLLGGQVAINGHITICDQAIFTGKAMVTRSITKPGIYSSGTGLMENKLWQRMVVRLRKLDALSSVMQKIEKLFLKGEH